MWIEKAVGPASKPLPCKEIPHLWRGRNNKSRQLLIEGRVNALSFLTGFTEWFFFYVLRVKCDII